MVKNIFFRFILITFLTLTITNISFASTSSGPQVGDYLVAKVSIDSNDYNVTKRYYQRILRKNPNNLLSLDRLLLLSILDGDIQSAKNYSFKLARVGCDQKRNACCMNNQSPQGHLINGISYINSYEFNFADQSFASIWQGDISDSTFIRLLRAWVWADKKNIEKSMALIDLISSNEHQHFALLHKALIYDFIDDIELAEIFYDLYLSQRNDLYVVGLYLNFLDRNDLLEKKEYVIDNYLNEYDNTFKASFLISDKNRVIQNQLQGIGVVLFNSSALIKDINTELNHMLYQLALETSPNLHEIKYLFSNFLINLGDLKKAQGILRMIPKKHYLGEYAAIQISDLYSQLNEEEKAIKNLVNYNKFNQTFDSLIALGNFYRYEKNWTLALDAYASSLDIALAQDNQNIWEVFFNIGIVHERTDNWNEAERNFNAALSIYEDQPDVLNYLGYSYLDKDLDLNLAKELIEKAMSLKPNDPYIIDSMAWYYFKVGRYEEALSLLDYVIDMMPYDATINDHYADTLWKIGHKLQARYHWERAIELDTEGELKDQIKEKLLIGI